MAVDPSSLLPITRDFLVEIGGWTTFKQAQALVEARRVEAVHYVAPILMARITGEREVQTRLKIGKTLAQVENLCTCRQAKVDGTICVHVVAAGLAYLQKQSGQKTSAPAAKISVASTSPTVVTGPRFQRQLAGEGIPLAVSLLLPMDMVAAWRQKQMRIIMEGAVGGRPAQPWGSLAKDVLYRVSEEDEKVLSVIEGLQGGTIPDVWVLEARDFNMFFNAIAGHPRLWLGKKKKMEVHAAFPATLHLALQKEGALELKASGLKGTGKGVRLEAGGGGGWWWNEIELRQEPLCPTPYRILAEQTVIIERAEIPRFLSEELPQLEKIFQIDFDVSYNDFHFEAGTPEIVVTLDGGLTGLSAQVEAVYGEKRFIVAPQTIGKNQSWWPDPLQRHRFVSRDLQQEKRVIAALMESGFIVGEREKERFFISGETKVASFLANHLPRWRAEWNVVLQPRTQVLLQKVDYVKPEMSFSSSGEDWLGFQIEFQTTHERSRISAGEVQRWLQTGRSFQRTSEDRILLLPTKALKEWQEVLADCQVAQEDGKYRVKPVFASYMTEALTQQGFALSVRSTWQPPTEKKGKSETLLLPAEKETLLRPYQKQGVQWIHGLVENGFGGILADEMGLGKTLQTLVYLEQLLKSRATGHAGALVIAPTSLVENWRREAEKFTPQLKVLTVQGSARHEAWGQLLDYDLIITSYALLRRDLAHYQMHEFAFLVLDEAQHIKNRSSQNAQSAKRLKARHRLVLTGTPLENSLFDLWSIFDFLMPTYLGTAQDFKERYEEPIAKLRDVAAQERLRLRLKPFVLRRTKEQVASDLPAKLEQTVLCDLTEEQAAVYHAILEQGRRDVFTLSGKAGQGRDKMAVLTTLLRLRQAACHLHLLPQNSEVKPKWQHPSGKWDYLEELLQEALDGGHRVLIFSQFVQHLQLAADYLRQQSLEFCYLDGSTRDRMKEVERFQQNPEIPLFLISLKAGGTGLNLTGADTVVHLDPWWNPAVEEQATARAHRIGQKRVVTSYKLIARGTVEEKIVQLQQRKKALMEANVNSEEVFIESLEWSEIEELLR